MLSCCLTGGGSYFVEQAVQLVRPDDFRDDTLGRMFEAVLEFWREKGLVELAAFAAWLSLNDRMSEFYEVLVQVPGQTYEPGLIREYAGAVGRRAYADRVGRVADRMKERPEEAATIAQELTQIEYPIGAAAVMGTAEMTDDVFRVYEDGTASGVSTGWHTVDELFTVKRSQLTVITGVPSLGKTTWLDALLVNLSERHGWKHLMWSPESWEYAEHQLPRLLQRHAGMPFHRGFNDRIPEEDIHDLLAWTDDHFRWLRPDVARGLDDIMLAAEQEMRRRPFETLTIDPFTEIARPSGTGLHEFVYDLLTHLDTFLQTHGVHVFVVAHPKKPMPGSTGPPTVYDIAESSHWANRSDAILCVHRESNTKHGIMLYVQKVRHRAVGKPGQVQLGFEPMTYRFNDVSRF